MRQSTERVKFLLHAPNGHKHLVVGNNDDAAVTDSGVIAVADAMPGVTIVLAGSLDEPAFFKPSVEIFCASAQPWMLEPSSQRKKFERMPG